MNKLIIPVADYMQIGDALSILSGIWLSAIDKRSGHSEVAEKLGKAIDLINEIEPLIEPAKGSDGVELVASVPLEERNFATEESIN